jgi:NTP pyrophosphatase (non-canonical NTP hydrolase)
MKERRSCQVFCTFGENLRRRAVLGRGLAGFAGASSAALIGLISQRDSLAGRAVNRYHLPARFGGNHDEARRIRRRFSQCFQVCFILETHPMHISEFQGLISQKYEQRDRERGIPRTFLWFIEEIGELATALAGQDQKNREEEFADVFAWLCTLANISDVDLEKACEKYTSGKVKGFKPK